MNLPTYYKKPLWCRAMRHLIPMTVAAFIGAGGIMLVDRADPVTVVWGKIIPPIVEPGQIITFHFGLIKHSDYSGHIHRWISDAHGVVLNLTDSNLVGDKLPFEHETEIVKDFPVPCGIGVGPAVYHSETHLWKYVNLAQWIWPVQKEVHYPFIVKQGAHNAACGFNEDGAPGKQGVPGIQGEPGKQGPAGGARGEQGIQGVPGKGEQGIQGIPGKQGVQGERGGENAPTPK